MAMEERYDSERRGRSRGCGHRRSARLFWSDAPAPLHAPHRFTVDRAERRSHHHHLSDGLMTVRDVIELGAHQDPRTNQGFYILPGKVSLRPNATFVRGDQILFETNSYGLRGS